MTTETKTADRQPEAARILPKTFPASEPEQLIAKEPRYEDIEREEAKGDPLERVFHCNSDELSTNFFYTLGKNEIFNCQFTLRGNPTRAEIESHLTSLVVAMKAVVHLGGHAKQVGQQPGLTPVTVAPVIPGLPGTNVAPPAAVAQVQSGEVPCVMIEVGTAYKSGKTQLKFHCAGFENPITYTREIADMLKLLAPLGFTAQHISIGQRYTVNSVVAWEQAADSKYKNVVAVRAA